MSYFSSPQEVDCYLGGILRLASVHPATSRRLAEPGVVLRIRCTEPDAQLTVLLADPVRVIVGLADDIPGVELTCPADVLDGFFRGRTSLLEALATGTATARGRISKILKVLPELEQLFPVYLALVASKDKQLSVVADLTS